MLLRTTAHNRAGDHQCGVDAEGKSVRTYHLPKIRLGNVEFIIAFTVFGL